MPKYGEKERAKPYSPEYQSWQQAAKSGNPNVDQLAAAHTRAIKKRKAEPDWAAMRARIMQEQANRGEKA